MLSWGLSDPTFHSVEECGVNLGDDPVKIQELDSVILMGPFQLKLFYAS